MKNRTFEEAPFIAKLILIGLIIWLLLIAFVYKNEIIPNELYDRKILAVYLNSRQKLPSYFENPYSISRNGEEKTAVSFGGDVYVDRIGLRKRFKIPEDVVLYECDVVDTKNHSLYKKYALSERPKTRFVYYITEDKARIFYTKDINVAYNAFGNPNFIEMNDFMIRPHRYIFPIIAFLLLIPLIMIWYYERRKNQKYNILCEHRKNNTLAD